MYSILEVSMFKLRNIQTQAKSTNKSITRTRNSYQPGFLGSCPSQIENRDFRPRKSFDLGPVLRGHEHGMMHGLILRFSNWNFFERPIQTQNFIMNDLRT